MSGQEAGYFKKVLAVVREHVSNAVVGGVFLVLTGFSPDHWIVEVLHAIRLPDSILKSWSFGLDPRIFLVSFGIAIIVGDQLLRRRTAVLPEQLAAAGHDVVFTPQIVASPQPQPAEHEFALPDIPSIVVLPFVNQSGKPDRQFICDGITQSIISALGRYHELLVIDWISSSTYKGKEIRPRDVAAELKVRFVLTGSVQSDVDRIRVSVELVDGDSSRQLWANRYDRESNDIFAFQDEVTEAIVATLMAGYGGRLRRAWVERRQLPGFERLEAVDLLYRALDGWDFTKQGMVVARELLDQAVQLDPGFAKAYSKQAFTHLIDATYGLTDDYMESMAKARKLALKAVSVDDGDSWAHWALGCYHMYTMHHDQALAEFRVALNCNPNDAEVMTDYGLCLSYSGQAEEGIDAALKAMRINPHHHDWYTAQLGQLYFDSRRYDKAIATFNSLKQFDSANMRVYQAASFAMLGRRDDASTSVRCAIELDPEASVNKWGNSRLAPYAKTSDLEHFRAALRKAGLPE
ncbi:MAG: hypothetical protein ABI705_05995 [Aestuariivirga sp.]